MNEALQFIDAKINSANETINKIIIKNQDERDYMSAGILSQLRYLVEYCFFRVYITDSVKDYVEFNHESNGKSIKYMKSRADMRELRVLHGFLQISTSHSLPNGDGTSRIMIKYLKYLLELKKFMFKKYKINILNNLYSFPINIEKNMKIYYSQISDKIKEVTFSKQNPVMANQYYVKKVKPIVINNNYFYEVTLTDATDYINKFNRIVVYCKEEIKDNYTVKLSISTKTIKLFDKNINIKIISNYKIAIRPCELNNYAKIFGLKIKVSSRYKEYDLVMKYLMDNKCSLLDIVEMNSDEYTKFGQKILHGSTTHYIFDLLNKSREIILKNLPGSNILSFFLSKLNNIVIKDQLADEPNYKLSYLYLNYGAIPFDQMPYASSLIKHKIDINDLLRCIDLNGRDHEIFARTIQYNADNEEVIYNKINDFNLSLEHINKLIDDFNHQLYLPKHYDRTIQKNNKYIYIEGYESSTINIIKKLKELALEKCDYYDYIYSEWENSTNYVFSDPQKSNLCKNSFLNSRVALLYGAAGCGKTETIKIISSIFENLTIAFLAKTNPAVENLKRRIGTDNINFSFMTIDKYKNKLKRNCISSNLLVIDECSTVDNYDMYEIISQSDNYDFLFLVGDTYQIESIKFGNWFKFAKELLPPKCIFELSGTFRTQNKVLLKLWSKVRNIDSDITEFLADNDMSEDLSKSIFNNDEGDEIILCLNYDGPYGINSINRYLQANNPNPSFDFGMNSYKVNDPVLFNDLNRFYPVLYNNLKGKIVNIQKNENGITFEILVNIFINENDANNVDLNIISATDNNTIVSFTVYSNEDDDIEDKKDCVVPFVVAYATSIHKSQGLEYESVKVVLNDEISELITHNIFYTSITRAKNKLKIYWSPECMEKILSNFSIKNNDDINIIKNKLESSKYDL